MQFLKRISLLLGGLLCIETMQAQEDSLSLDPVTVSSTLRPVALSKTGRNITVIQGAQIQHLPVHSIDDLMRYMPGIETQARGPLGAQSDFVMRGGTFQQVLVVLDGLRLNDPVTGHFSSYIPINISEIERIEILKGASSALYGSDAVGGVIHIITKSFAAKQGMGFSKSLGAEIIAGEYGLWKTSAGGHYSKGNTIIAGGMQSLNADGQQLRGMRGYVHSNNVSFSVSHFLNPNWQVSFRSAFDRRSFAAQNFYTTSKADSATEKVTSFWNQAVVRYQKGRDAFSLHGGFKKLEDDFQFNPSVVANQNHANLLQALALYERNISDNAQFITGAQFQQRSIRSNDRGNHAVKQAAVFAIWQQTFSKLHAAPALRLDWDALAGAELVPQVNLSYKTGLFVLRGSAGKTIRQADFTERYNNYNKAKVPSQNRVGNPALSAEKSFSYEAGVDVYPIKNLKVAATFFQRHHRELIDFAATPFALMPRQHNLDSSGSYFLAQNIARIITSGFESDMSFLKSFGGKQFFATAGLVWLRSANGDAPASLYISSHAKLLTNFMVSFSNKAWSFGINGLYKHRAAQTAAALGASLSTDYFVMNAKAERFLFNKKASLIVQADNIFNRSYSDLLGAQMPGRWLMAGVRFKL